MDIEDYERDRVEKKLLMKLQEAEEAIKDSKDWLNLDELKAIVGEELRGDLSRMLKQYQGNTRIFD